MNYCSLLIGALATALSLSTLALAEPTDHQPEAEVVSIPLEQIWGYNMPGTRDLGELGPQRDARTMTKQQLIDGSYVLQIERILVDRPRHSENHREPAFVVKGTGREALVNAKAEFVRRSEFGWGQGQKRTLTVRPDTDISLVFFTFAIGDSVKLDSICRHEANCTVKYRLVPRMTMDVRVHLALIPLGKFSEGLVRVDIVELPPSDRQGEGTRKLIPANRFVCDSFSFGVEP